MRGRGRELSNASARCSATLRIGTSLRPAWWLRLRYNFWVPLSRPGSRTGEPSPPDRFESDLCTQTDRDSIGAINQKVMRGRSELPCFAGCTRSLDRDRFALKDYELANLLGVSVAEDSWPTPLAG